ncbi:large ribosomal subunit protein bL9m isoform X2 [Denticeps clupeoides]|uniref:Large ribosomal subunit protein bL9m n=2 Tax=Denticeps clupeoides TaxID=299321 RepID=A0AAY4EWF4_9TELE|nr:39S ribosomal protein L9, mitochondrial isoform X2 [Denticeps clupeoides]XP_028820424.1 39S ribosomal protein L9, mitochondrial isoform X2 [Denticeps clupeoides]XP_028820425.1 39S ribosomal protein L9, mitochondrial isoform X2 [Denticeps clupeoides]
MWSCRSAVANLLTEVPRAQLAQRFSQTTCKSTVIVERWWQVPLSQEGRPPRLYPRRHRVYRFVEDTKHAPKEKMALILTQTVSKLGGRGDTVFVKKSVGRNKLLPQGLAVYPSPENKAMFADELRLLREGKAEDKIQTRTGELTVKFLKNTHLEVGLHTSIQYQITKEIVCRHFLRKLGLVVPPHALTLPDEPITQPGEYWCEVTVNGLDTVRVPVSVIPFVEPKLRREKRRQEAQQSLVSSQEESVEDGVTNPKE